MRLTSIEEVRDLNGSIDESYVHARLSDIVPTSEIGKIALDFREYILSERAASQLCRVLRVPYYFACSMSSQMPDLWKELSGRITTGSQKEITFKVDDESLTVIGLFPRRSSFISLRRFLEITDDIYRKVHEEAGVENMVVDIDDVSSSAFFYTPVTFCPIEAKSEDLFRYGIGFSASSLEMYAPSISESLLRLICTNMTYAPTYGGMHFKSRNVERILNAVDLILDEPERISRYPEALSALTEKRLSYRELENSYSYIARLKDEDGEILVPDLERRIPITRVAIAYGYENPEAIPASLSWKSSARTPINAYEVFNHLTEIGSHYTHIPEKDRLNLLIHAGGLMFKKNWDLDNLAPQVDFSNWENPQVQYAVH
ncbi:MAG: hypothetical protein RIG61_01000 [Deltaproteobacteria bacterium]